MGLFHSFLKGELMPERAVTSFTVFESYRYFVNHVTK